MTFVNGDYAVPFDCIAQDHKRAFDNDQGPNTGGMGAYCPVHTLMHLFLSKLIRRLLNLLLKLWHKKVMTSFGLLYIGAILTKDGPKVIEFNARFGDPEAQVLLTRLESDLMQLIIDLENCKPIHFNWKDEAVVGVMLASKG